MNRGKEKRYALPKDNVKLFYIVFIIKEAE